MDDDQKPSRCYKLSDVYRLMIAIYLFTWCLLMGITIIFVIVMYYAFINNQYITVILLGLLLIFICICSIIFPGIIIKTNWRVVCKRKRNNVELQEVNELQLPQQETTSYSEVAVEETAIDDRMQVEVQSMTD